MHELLMLPEFGDGAVLDHGDFVCEVYRVQAMRDVNHGLYATSGEELAEEIGLGLWIESGRLVDDPQIRRFLPHKRARDRDALPL